jgi:hypothetical protein
MSKTGRMLLLILLLMVTFVVTGAGQPPEVPRLANRHLDHASYADLLRQWKDYIEKHGESAHALVNLGRAYQYCNEQDAATNTGRRAVELDPDNPEALAFFGAQTAIWLGDPEGSLELLERCRKIAPDYEYGLTLLATSYMRLGRISEADGVFKTIFELNTIPGPLQDYAYNMLVGLPEGAVLLTGGDNDTFPPLALQAGMDFRIDVAVLNKSLLTLPEYSEGLFKRYPAIKPDDKIKHDEHFSYNRTVIKRLIEDQDSPVYFVASTNFDYIGFEPDFKPDCIIEGFNLFFSKKGMSTEESSALILDTYRLDSATDWKFPWSLYPQVGRLMQNYVTAMVKLSEQENISAGTRRRLLEKSLEISSFHDFDRLTIYIEKSLKEL